jgi:hypothetical protein
MLKKRNLYEVDYKDILKPETLAMLKGKSKQNLQQMLADRSIMQALRNMKGLAAEIQAAEADYRDELEMVAKQIVTDAYPIIDYADIQIDAKIVPQVKPLTNLDPDEEDPAAPDFGDQDPEKLKAKRRIINGITQGAALKGTFAFLMFREYLDQLDPTLVDKYVAITKAADVPYNDENVIAMMMAQIEQGQMAGEGQSEMVYDDETEKFTIIARATNFPVLVHEIVKGLYEITGTEGFGRNKEKNQAIVKAVDKAGNEPEDLQLGRYFEEAISDLYNQSKIDDPRVRDFFFAEVYKLDEDEFLSFVENAVNGELEAYQKKWATNTMQNIKSELESGELDEQENFDLSDNPVAGGLRGGDVLVVDILASRYFSIERTDIISNSNAELTARNIYDKTVEDYIDHDYIKGLEFINIEKIAPGFYIVETGEEIFVMVFDRLYEGIKKVLSSLDYDRTDFINFIDTVFTTDPNYIMQGINEPQYVEWRASLEEGAGTQHYLMLTPKQLELFKRFGAKYNSNSNELYVPELLKIEIDKNVVNSDFKKEFYDLVPPEYKQLSTQVLTGIKKSLTNPIKINNQPYYALKGKKSKKDTFYFDNPYTKKNLPEGAFSKAISGAALAAALFAGNPAQAQNPIVGKVSSFLKKLQPTAKVDTVKVQKDTPLVLAKFKDYKGAGYGYAKSPNESTAYKIAKKNATQDLLQKIGQQEITVGIEEKAVKHYINPDGTHEYEVLLVVGDLNEGFHDPVKPGILKKKLGNLSCSGVRSAKSKLKDKGTHYAKALQRYLNYHC